LWQNEEEHLLLDVRSETQFQICRFPHAINVPLKKLQETPSSIHEMSNGKPGRKIELVQYLHSIT